MAQTAFRHHDFDNADLVPGADILAPSVSLFAAPAVHDELALKCRASGFAIAGTRPLVSLVEGVENILGDIVLADCREIDMAAIAALLRLDERAGRSGARVIVLASDDSLDDVFGCLTQASVQYLVDPRPGELSLALVRALPGVSQNRVRELDEGDRAALLRLTEEVGRLAAKLDHLALPLGTERDGAMTGRLASPGLNYRGEEPRDPLRRPRPALPDPRLIQRIIRQRRLRARYFEAELFADPAWDILLDLTAARAEHRRVSVTSLCIAAAVPATTALRWIQQMTAMGILVRRSDPEDKRRAFIELSDSVADAMARYFDELGKDAAKLI